VRTLQITRIGKNNIDLIKTVQYLSILVKAWIAQENLSIVIQLFGLKLIMRIDRIEYDTKWATYRIVSGENSSIPSDIIVMTDTIVCNCPS
jgi:hypothetical protein